MGSDLEYFRANDPFTLAVQNADLLRDRTFIRIVAHIEPDNWLAPRCEELHQVLMKHTIPHEFFFLSNVKSHDPSRVFDAMGDDAFSFFSSSLPRGSAGAAAGGSARPPAPPPASGSTPAFVPVAPTGGWEQLSDGTMGCETEFRGVDGLPISAYVRKPAGAGPFPVIVSLHGGRNSRQATIGSGRGMRPPLADLVKQGWVVFSADYRPQEKIGIYPIEFDDTVKAVEAARALPFVDPKRVGYLGHSHGAQVGTRVVSRVDLCGAVLMAPAAMDFIEIKKARKSGVKLAGVLDTMLGVTWRRSLARRWRRSKRTRFNTATVPASPRPPGFAAPFSS